MNKKSSLFIVVTALLLSLTTPAQAADTGYRYWGYFQAAPKATAWTSAMTGPTVDVADGAVEGWAFTFSGGAVPDASSPSVAPDFQALCGKTRPMLDPVKSFLLDSRHKLTIDNKGRRSVPMISVDSKNGGHEDL